MKNALRAILLMLLSSCNHRDATLPVFVSNEPITDRIVINEVMPSNSISIHDEDGDLPDWIELYNPSNDTLSLKGWFLSDQKNHLSKWQFPDLNIYPGHYYMVFASGKDRIEGQFLHANFKLKGSETLYLSSEDSILSDSLVAQDCASDQSYGKWPNAHEQCAKLTSHTAWKSNNLVNAESMLEFSIEGGLIQHDDILTIVCNSKDSIYFTIDGSVPIPGHSNTNLYTSPIRPWEMKISHYAIGQIKTTGVEIEQKKWHKPSALDYAPSIICAQAWRNNKPSSTPQAATYFFEDEDLPTLPILSIQINKEELFDQDSGIYVAGKYLSDKLKSGNYYKTGKYWERKCQLAYFDEHVKLVGAQNCGLRIHGDLSRAYPQKSLRFYARKEYGEAQFAFTPFTDPPTSSHLKRLVLRTPYSGAGYSFVTDPIVQRIAQEMNLSTQAAQPVACFINGEYWGIQIIRERLDKFFINEKYQIENLDYLSRNSEILSGDDKTYKRMLNFAANNDLGLERNYTRVAAQIDLANYIDIHILETFFNNLDWPHNNVEYFKERTEQAKWQWLLVDMDACFSNPKANVLDTLLMDQSWSTLLFRRLWDSPQFRKLYFERYEDLADDQLSIGVMNNAIDYYEALLENEIGPHIARWGYPAEQQDFKNAMEMIRDFCNARPQLYKRYLDQAISR